uniref:Uncharacterized protein n=1 Tax=Cacopsylla melanoneura TaxID=428564 RepID=A0A8D8LH31_9HEMI
MDSMEVPLLIIIVPPPEDSESVVTVRDGNEGSRKKQKRPSLRSSKDYSVPAGSNLMFSFHAYTIPKHTSAVRLDQQMQLDSEIACLEKTLNNTFFFKENMV